MGEDVLHADAVDWVLQRSEVPPESEPTDAPQTWEVPNAQLNAMNNLMSKMYDEIRSVNTRLTVVERRQTENPPSMPTEDMMVDSSDDNQDYDWDNEGTNPYNPQ